MYWKKCYCKKTHTDSGLSAKYQELNLICIGKNATVKKTHTQIVD